MQERYGPAGQQRIAGSDAPVPAETFFAAILGRMELRGVVEPCPAAEDPGHPTVRMLQRARRQTWLHARHVLGWSMFRAVRVSQRLGETFAEWSRSGGDMEGLRAALVGTSGRLSGAEPLHEHLRFLDSLIDSVRDHGASREDFALARDALRRLEEHGRAAG